MTSSARVRTNFCGLLAIVGLSSATMLWLFWHYPLATAIATIAILSALGMSARLARWIDTDMSDRERRKQSA